MGFYLGQIKKTGRRPYPMEQLLKSNMADFMSKINKCTYSCDDGSSKTGYFNLLIKYVEHFHSIMLAHIIASHSSPIGVSRDKENPQIKK